MHLKFLFEIICVHIPLKLMGNGFGDHGVHALPHVQSEPEPGQQTRAMVHSTLGCHAREVDKKVKPAKVN